VNEGKKTRDFRIKTAISPDDHLCGYEGDGTGPDSEIAVPILNLQAATSSPYWQIPETFGALGVPGHDDTPAIQQAEATLPPGGGMILLRPGTTLYCNWQPTRNNVRLAAYNGAGDNNFMAGLAPYDPALPVITVGGTLSQLYRFGMQGVRVYSPIGDYGVLVQSCIGLRIVDCEIGGFIKSAFRIYPGGPNANVLYGIIRDTYFFSVAASNGYMLDLSHGAGTAQAVEFSGCGIDGAAGTGQYFRAVQLDGNYEWSVNQCWVQCKDRKGIRMRGTPSARTNSRILGGLIRVDSPNNTDVLIEWESTEKAVTSYVSAEMRVDGWGQPDCMGATLPAPIEMKGEPYEAATGFRFMTKTFRPTFIGPYRHVDTSAPDMDTGPLWAVGGGPPPPLTPEGNPWPIGSHFTSVNNGGSGNTDFVMTDSGWENSSTGGYIDQVGPNVTVASETANIGDQPGGGPYKGSFAFVDGTGNLRYLGSVAGGKRPLITIQFTSTLTIVHAPSAPGIFVTQYQRNIVVQSGDFCQVHAEGSLWRMTWVTTVGNRAL
jgi:hypothetical protein